MLGFVTSERFSSTACSTCGRCDRERCGAFATMRVLNFATHDPKGGDTSLANVSIRLRPFSDWAAPGNQKWRPSACRAEKLTQRDGSGSWYLLIVSRSAVGSEDDRNGLTRVASNIRLAGILSRSRRLFEIHR